MQKRVIARGAEATLYLDEYLGRPALVKDRAPKKYRNPELDLSIRNARTRQECTLLHRAKELGVRSPVIYKVDRRGTRIFMEFCKWKRLKDVLGTGNIGVCRDVGEAIGKLHAGGLVHGDLTTSNILIHNGNLCFVDFGLGFNSEKVEDKAVDLLVFKKTFMATHFSLPEGWELIAEGYVKEYPAGKKVLERVPEIEARVRYH